MDSTIYSTPATDAAVAQRAQVSIWAGPQHGIRMPFPRRLRSTAVLPRVKCMTTATTAAQGATNVASGDEALEDPV